MSNRNNFPLNFSRGQAVDDGNLRHPPANGRPRRDRGDDFHRGVMGPTSQDNGRIMAPAPYWPYEQRATPGPIGFTRFPLTPYYPPHIIILNGNMAQEPNPTPVQFPYTRSLPPFTSQTNFYRPTQDDDSRLTREEQEIVLKKLKKDIYNPKTAKTLSKRLSLYYREYKPDNIKALEKCKDEDGKRCAICLDDFEPNEEVILTPCSHMFHEDCVVPWVKNHGKCPVCRFALCDRVRENAPGLNNVGRPVSDDLLSHELLSVIRAMEEVFPWRA